MKNLPRINLAISIMALVISGAAVYYSIQADKRSEKIDRQVSQAIMEYIGNKLKRYADNAHNSYLFLSRFIDITDAHPEQTDKAEALTLDYLHKLDLSGLSIQEDLLFQLAKSESDVANKIAQCLSALAEIKDDIQPFAEATHNTLTTTQRLTLAVMPYRFRNVGMICEEADKSLTLQIRAKYPPRGTLGELNEAQILRMERRLNPPQVNLSVAPVDEGGQEEKN